MTDGAADPVRLKSWSQGGLGKGFAAQSTGGVVKEKQTSFGLSLTVTVDPARTNSRTGS